MTWLSRIRPRFWLRLSAYLVGVGLVIGSLLGARELTSTGQSSEPHSRNDAKKSKIAGPVVLGTVDSKDQMVSYGLAPVIQSGTIAKRLVKDGDVVKAGDPLYVFDTVPLQSQLEVAKRAVEVAKAKKNEAVNARVLHASEVRNAELAVTIAEKSLNLKASVYNLVKNNLVDVYKRDRLAPQPALTQEEIDGKLNKDPELMRANVEWNVASFDLDQKKAVLQTLKDAATRLTLQIEEAEAVVKQAEAKAEEAEKAIGLCTIRAKLDGTIEQVTISEGSTLGVGTMKPALWLVPAGPRIVRAEIEAEFAHQITNAVKGREVTIYDNNDPKLTYKGKVRRIGETFLPKRSSNPGLLNSDTLVLEAEVEVLDAAPSDRPPLRVGQRVRVDLGAGQ